MPLYNDTGNQQSTPGRPSLGRRRFVRQLVLLSLGSQIPWWTACDTAVKTLNTGGVLTASQAEIADFVFDWLLPDDSHGPSAREINAYPFFLWVLQDPHYDPEQQTYYKQGLDWVEETCVEDYNGPFHTINIRQRQTLLDKIRDTNWGESWLASMLTVTIEALLGDPIYGCNPNGASWEWLGHQPGQPRPDEHTRYPIILNRKMEGHPITKIDQL